MAVIEDYDPNFADKFLKSLGDGDVEQAAAKVCLQAIKASRRPSTGPIPAQVTPSPTPPRVVDESDRVAIFHRHLKGDNPDFTAFAAGFVAAKNVPSEEHLSLAHLWAYNHGAGSNAQHPEVARLILEDPEFVRGIEAKLRLVVTKNLFEVYPLNEDIIELLRAGGISTSQVMTLLADRDFPKEIALKAISLMPYAELAKLDSGLVDKLFVCGFTASEWLRYARKYCIKNREIARVLLIVTPDADAANRLLIRRTGFLKHLPTDLRDEIASRFFRFLILPHGWLRLARKAGLTDRKVVELITERCVLILQKKYSCHKTITEGDILFLSELLKVADDTSVPYRDIATDKELSIIVECVRILAGHPAHVNDLHRVCNETRRRRFLHFPTR